MKIKIDENEKIDEFHMRAWRAFINAHATIINQIEHELAKAKSLPLSSYDVLVALSETPDQRLRMHELANRVVLSRSGLTRLVDRLEIEGLLTRDRCGTDRRGAYAVLTDKGREALQQAWPVYEKGIIQHFTSLLQDSEVSVISDALERVASTKE